MHPIEKLIQADDRDGARRLIRHELKKSPDNHWLLTRLSLTYYEQKKYRTSLRYSKKAFALAPKCPLVLWDLAGTLEMLGDTDKSIELYQGLIKRGAKRIANGPCGEGLGWARGLIADCYYRLAHCYDTNGLRTEAQAAFEKHLDLRGPGCNSIYKLKEL